MNLRIFELYGTAVSETKRYHKQNPKADQDDLNEFCAEQFSRMIIEECVEICNKVYFDNYPEADEWECSQEGDAILENFGLA